MVPGWAGRMVIWGALARPTWHLGPHRMPCPSLRLTQRAPAVCAGPGPPRRAVRESAPHVACASVLYAALDLPPGGPARRAVPEAVPCAGPDRAVHAACWSASHAGPVAPPRVMRWPAPQAGPVPGLTWCVTPHSAQRLSSRPSVRRSTHFTWRARLCPAPRAALRLTAYPHRGVR